MAEAFHEQKKNRAKKRFSGRFGKELGNREYLIFWRLEQQNKLPTFFFFG